MKSLYYFVLCILITTKSFSQSFNWVREVKGITYDNQDYIMGQAIDGQENSYIIGATESWFFDIDPTPGGQTILDNSSTQNFRMAYLIKLDAAGNYLWGLTFGNSHYDENAVDVKIGSNGLIYALVKLPHYNPTLGYNSTYYTVYKISPEGSILSSIDIPVNYGTGNIIYPGTFELDADNNIFIGGWYQGTITFSNTNPALNLPQVGIGTFIFKLNSSGTFQWTKQVSNNGLSLWPIHIRPDGNLNVILGSIPNSTSSGYTLFDIDNATNAVVWQKSFINQFQSAYHVSTNGITILGSKNQDQTVDVDPSPSGVTSISGNTIFLIFLDLQGNFLEAKQFQMAGTSTIDFRSLTTDVAGNYYFGGEFQDTIDFDASDNTNLVTSGYFGDAYLLKYDASRNFESVIKFGQEVPLLSPYNICESLRINKINTYNDNIHLVGIYNRVCDFDVSPTSQVSLNSLNSGTYNYNGFIQKLGGSLGVTSAISDRELTAYPNPVEGILYFQNGNVNRVEVYDMMGRLLKAVSVVDNSVDLHDLSAGQYIAKTYFGNKVSLIRIVKR